MEEFELVRNADGWTIGKYLGSASAVSVPERLNGLPVTELAAYAFYGKRELEEVTLPQTVRRVGAHCFYDCRNLRRIACHDGISESGDGCFKNCRALSEVTYALCGQRFGFLRNLLEECSRKVTVRFTEDGEVRAVLLFPRFLQDYEENTAARIINQVTYGAGVHYRACVGEHGIDFAGYDGRFSLLKNIEAEEICGETALYRLAYPMELKEAARAEYLDYLHRNLRELMEAFLAEERYDLAELLADAVSDAEREVLLRAAQEAGALSVVSSLLQKHAAKRRAEDEFDL